MIHAALDVQKFSTEILRMASIDADTTMSIGDPDPALERVIKLCLANNVSSSSIEDLQPEDLLDYISILENFHDKAVGGLKFVYELNSRLNVMKSVVHRRLL